MCSVNPSNAHCRLVEKFVDRRNYDVSDVVKRPEVRMKVSWFMLICQMKLNNIVIKAIKRLCNSNINI